MFDFNKYSLNNIVFDWRNIPGKLILDPRLAFRNGKNYPAGELIDGFWNVRWLGTDQFGFVYNGDEPEDYDPGDTTIFRCFLFGGSTVQGLGAQQNRHTISSVLHKSLVDNHTKKSRVINCGVGSYTSWQQMSYLSLEIIFYNPDYIIILDGLNDFTQSVTLNNLNYIPNVSKAMNRLTIRMLSDQIAIDQLSMMKFATSKLLRIPGVLKAARFARGLVSILYEDLNAEVKPQHSNSIDYAGHIKHGIDCYIKNILSVIGIGKHNKAKVIHLFQPQLIYGNRIPTEIEKGFIERIESKNLPLVEFSGDWYNGVRARYDEVKQFHNGDDIWVEDASNWLSEYKETVYHDWCHYNQLGQSIIAERIAEIVRKMG